MVANLKRVFLFIGMVIGAGFATGRELVLYFYGTSPSTIALAGVLMGIMFALFLAIGNRWDTMRQTRGDMLVRGMVSVAVVAMFVVMCAGAEQLLYEVTAWRYLGVATGVVAVLIARRGMDGIKNVNFVIVPLLIALIFALTRGVSVDMWGKVAPMSSLSYVSMNMLVAGYLILAEGERVCARDIAISGTLVAVIFSVLLFLGVKGVWRYATCDMPLFALSTSRNMRYVGGLIIFLAILSTLISSARMIYVDTNAIVGSASLATLLVLILPLIAIFVDFARAVDVVYSIEGVLGLVFFVYALVKYVLFICRCKKYNVMK